MKWPLGNGGASYLNDVTDTVQTVQYSDSQCTVHMYTQLPPRQPPTSRSLSTLVLVISTIIASSNLHRLLSVSRVFGLDNSSSCFENQSIISPKKKIGLKILGLKNFWVIKKTTILEYIVLDNF